jgi:outer membrane protein assembly factor BamB
VLGRFALAGLAIAAMAIGAWPGSAAAATSSDDWAVFHHDALHTGVSPDTVIGAAAAPSLGVQWSHPVGGGSTDPVYASPAVAYNATLTKTLVYDVSVSGTVRAYDTTGAEIWTSPQNVGGGAVGSPAVDGNTLYVGSDNGVLTALDATTGAFQCSYTLPIYAPETAPGRIEDAPVVGHDITGPIVYFGDTGQSESMNHGHEWAINGVGNTAGACTLKWAHDLGSTGGKRNGSWSPPALVTDSTSRPLLVFGTSQPDDAVYALDARDGSLVWRFQTLKNFSDADVGAGPTISAPGVNGFADGVVYIDGKDKQEYAIDLLTGTQLWTFDLESDTAHSTNSVSCAALVGNLVVVAYWKYVYAFNATTGAKVWRSVAGAGSTLGSVSVSGAPGDQVVLRADLSGDEYAYRLSDGSLLKTIKVASTPFASSTAVADGMAFIAGENGSLYALGVPGSANTPIVTGVSPSSGTPAGGTSVTISGLNFTGVSAVVFGGTAAASFTFVSDTTVTAMSPAGSGTVDVRVTTGNGTSAISSSDQFSYASGSAPVVTSISPTSGPAAGGTVVTITGSNFTGATEVTFGGKAATFTIVSDTKITCTSPGGSPGTVNVVVHAPAGISSKTHQFTYV